jgi:hypothetical protein
MGTLLKTPKMNRALAARVEASVRKGSSHGAAVDRKWTVLFRFAILFGAIGSVVSIFVMQKRDDARLEQSRSALLDTVRVERGRLRDTDMMNLERSTQVLVRAAGRYEGDLVTSEVRGAEALNSALSRPLVYVRGPLESFKNDEGIALVAQASMPDAFVADARARSRQFCGEPSPSRTDGGGASAALPDLGPAAPPVLVEGAGQGSQEPG